MLATRMRACHLGRTNSVPHACAVRPTRACSSLRRDAGDRPVASSKRTGTVPGATSSSSATAHAPASSSSAPPMTATFHLAFPVRDIEEARLFYGGLLGCPEGRSSKTWVDFNFYGHQIVVHQVANYNAANTANAVDGDAVPVPHFGLALSVDQFQSLATHLKANGVHFEIAPHRRFVGAPGEQWTMFFLDPSGNALEFKAMVNPGNLFARYTVI